jgi:hypothetical protein
MAEALGDAALHSVFYTTLCHLGNLKAAYRGTQIISHFFFIVCIYWVWTRPSKQNVLPLLDVNFCKKHGNDVKNKFV